MSEPTVINVTREVRETGSEGGYLTRVAGARVYVTLAFRPAEDPSHHERVAEYLRRIGGGPGAMAVRT